MARIVLKKDTTELCDGSIIGQRWIITGEKPSKFYPQQFKIILTI